MEVEFRQIENEEWHILMDQPQEKALKIPVDSFETLDLSGIFGAQHHRYHLHLCRQRWYS